jgi:tetratricopeptide (TPR) repeat protein
MFKRLVERLSGKNTAQPPAAAPPPPTNARPADSELIKIYDGYGRELQMPRADWRDKVLLPNIKANWDAPDALYGSITNGLQNGVAAELQDASQHLLAIDPNIERSHVTRGILLMRLARFAEAESVFQDAVAKVGETGTLLTNLAKLEAQRGEHAKAEATLWRALELDPNLDHGLGWWISLHQEREGEAGYMNALVRVTALADSWRAQLYLARYYLQKGEVEIARLIYQEVLNKGGYGNEALTTISGDLGNAGQVPLMVELIAPVLDLQKHDARAGLNLLQAYVQLREPQAGEALLSKLYTLNLPPFKQHLDRYAQEFQRLRDEAYTPAAIDPKALEVVMVPYDRPVWMYGLRDPSWLFTNKDPAAKKVVFLSFTYQMSADAQAQQQRENAAGRLSRVLPMYLAESMHVWSDLQGVVMIPVARGGGPVLFGADNNDEQTVRSFESAGDFIVHGSLGEREGRWHAVCRIWSVAGADWIAREELSASMQELGAEVLKLEQRILAALGNTRATPVEAWYERPAEKLVDPYLMGLGQSLTLSLIANQLMPKEGLWGERNLIEWWLRMALGAPTAHVPRLAYLAAIANAAEYGSPLLEEFAVRTRELMKDNARIDSPAAKLAPVMWKAFGMADELRSAAQTSAEAGADDAYGQWLDRVIHPRQPETQEGQGEGG